MIRHELPSARLERCFRALEKWAVLRNPDIFANFERGGDCDLLVANREAAACRIEREMGSPFRIAERSYVTSLYYEWGHLDLAEHVFWQGLRLIDGRDILGRCDRSGVWPVVSRVDEAIVMLLNSLLWGGFVKRRYCSDIQAAFSAEADLTAEILWRAVGSPVARRLETLVRQAEWEDLERSVAEIRRRVRSHQLRLAPLRSMVGTVRFLGCECRVRMKDLVPVLTVRLNGADAEVVREACVRLGHEAEYRVAVTNGRGVLTGLRHASFRAKNGLVVVLDPAGAPDGSHGPTVELAKDSALDPQIASGIERVRAAGRKMRMKDEG